MPRNKANDGLGEMDVEVVANDIPPCVGGGAAQQGVEKTSKVLLGPGVADHPGDFADRDIETGSNRTCGFPAYGSPTGFISRPTTVVSPGVCVAELRQARHAHNTSHNLWIFAVLNTAHRALTHRLQCSVVQLSRVVFPHDSRESYSPDPVKVVYLLMY